MPHIFKLRLKKNKDAFNALLYVDDAGSNIRTEDSDENMDAFGATLDTTDINLENFQYLVDNNDSHVLEKSTRSMVTMNQVNEHDDS